MNWKSSKRETECGCAAATYETTKFCIRVNLTPANCQMRPQK